MTDLSTAAAREHAPTTNDHDVIIVGSGMGGGSLAYALKDAGKRVLLIERGDFLPQEPQNWSPKAVFGDKVYKNAEQWVDPEGNPFDPGTYYYVGGNTKLYGSSLVRFRREDFQQTEHQDGISPRWPFDYDVLAPYYQRAEQALRVHGDHTDDPTLPRTEPYPYPAIGHEPEIQKVADAIRQQGFTPSNIPLGIDLRDGGACIRCKTCDGFPCRTLAKSDADVCFVRPALAAGNVELLTNAYVEKVLVDDTGTRATGVQVQLGATTTVYRAKTVVVSCGAVNSAALLLRSATSSHPDGLANSSGLVGRHYMVHNNTVMVTINPARRNRVTFQKTLYFNDFYLKGTSDHPYPLGHVQLIGKLQGEMLKNNRPKLPVWALKMAADRSMDWWLFTEDLPSADNRVTLSPSGRITVHWTPNNLEAHAVLTREVRKLMRSIGFPLVFSERTGIAVNSHQAGTIVAGEDPSTSVLDSTCRAHDLENLYVVDSSFFPSLPVMNPALTIAANGLRVGEHITKAH